MDRLKNLQTHFTSAPMDSSHPSAKEENLLQYYKAMSDLNGDFLQNLGGMSDYPDLARKFGDILTNRRLFEHETNEEDSRPVKRIKANQRILAILKEAKKIVPFNELFSDLMMFMSFGGQIYLYDEALATKFTVNFQLYYKTIENLGTEIHQSWKTRCEDGEDIGCFGLTELGHGSNVRGILTTATYDHASKEFILHTPSEKAMKFWIGGAGKTSNVAAIFAQLIVGEKSYGPHVFLVPIRDKNTHFPFPGVTLGDCGKKEGQDGIDNGFIIFNNYRVPKENLLNRFGYINDDGTYESSIKSDDQRFALQLGALSSGRILIILGAQANLQTATKIAIRFAAMRTQFGKQGDVRETALIEYPLHQYRLFPLVANTFAINAAGKKIVRMWGKNQKKLFVPNNPKLAEVHAFISVMKGLSSWSAFKGIAECRQACGGLGYSHYSRFSIMMNNLDVNQTWEGDNNVLLQQTGKYLLDVFKMKMKGKIKKTVTCEWIKIEPVEGHRCNADTEETFLHPINLIEIFEYRANLLLQRTGWELSGKLQEKGVHPIDAWNNTQVFFMHDLAKAYGELMTVSEFYNTLKDAETQNDDTKECITMLFRLHALHRIQQDIGIWLETEYLNQHHVGMIKSQIMKTCETLKRHMVALTYYMSPSEDLFDSMLAPKDGQLYKSIVNRIYSAPGVFERIETWKDLYEKH